ncbi:MAG: hypothetical protein ACOC4Y_01255 [bacterium]
MKKQNETNETTVERKKKEKEALAQEMVDAANDVHEIIAKFPVPMALGILDTTRAYMASQMFAAPTASDQNK